MLKELNQISSDIIHQNPFWTYRHDEYQMPNGKTGDYYYVDSPGSVFVIPVTADGKILMTRQFRYLNKSVSLEFPGGGAKPKLSALDNAKAELREETGGISEDFEILGKFNPFKGVTNEICVVFLAKNVIFSNAQPEESEEFEIYLLTPSEINGKIQSGELWDGMSLAAWALYLCKYMDLEKK